MKDVYQFLTQDLLLSYPILRAFSAAGLNSDAPGKNLASVPECVNTSLCLTVSTCFTAVDFSDCSVNLNKGKSISACFTSKIFFFLIKIVSVCFRRNPGVSQEDTSLV